MSGRKSVFVVAAAAFSSLLLIQCSQGIRAVESVAAVEETPPQFLSLPVHPRPQADGNGWEDDYNQNGIYRRGSHYIWHAPLVDGEPPGMTMDNEAGEADAPASGPETGAPSTGGTTDIDVSNAGDSYQGETAAASNGTVIVAGSNNIFPGQCSTQRCGVLAYTSTNGTSFARSEISMTWKGATFGITFDPWLDVDTDGNFYYVFGGAPLSGNYPNSIAVSKSGPNGLSWGAPVAVTYNANKYFDDKYALAIDRSTSNYRNRLYVSWDRNTATNQILYVSYSSNGGATWSSPVKVDDGKTQFERVIGAYPAVDHSTGIVYTSWHNYSKNVIYVDKSTNGGAKWGTDVAAATTNTGFGMDIGCNGGRKQSPAHHLRVGPSGRLHLVYANNVANRGYDILYKWSTNQGASWNGPIRLNDDTGAAHQFHPTLSVESNGNGGDKVTVTFYDRRDDAANCKSHVYFTRSFDSGATWSANDRLTDVSSDFTGNPNGPGDYSSSAPWGEGVYPFHSDHRNPDFDVYSSPVGLCDGVICTAEDLCHSASCDPDTGACVQTPLTGTECNDGDACTQTDTCQAGACVGSNPVVCTASDQCHNAGICDPTTGTCSNPTKGDGEWCDDGDLCTQTDTCQGGACMGSDAVVCSVPDACHAPGTCDPATGICSASTELCSADVCAPEGCPTP